MKTNGRINDEIELLWDGDEYVVFEEEPPVVRAEPIIANC
jgi:hypothetical protein